MNSAAIHDTGLFVDMFAFFFNGYLGVELLGHMMTLCLTFQERLFSKAAIPFFIPTSSV